MSEAKQPPSHETAVRLAAHYEEYFNKAMALNDKMKDDYIKLSEENLQIMRSYSARLDRHGETIVALVEAGEWMKEAIKKDSISQEDRKFLLDNWEDRFQLALKSFKKADDKEAE